MKLYTCCAYLVLGIALVVGLAWSFWPKYNFIHFVKAEKNATLSGPTCDPALGEDLGRDIAEKGFSVVGNVITSDSQAKIMDYANQQPFTNYFSGYRNGDINHITSLVPELWPKLEKLIKTIQDTTSIRVADENGNTANSFKAMEFLTANASDPSKSVAHIWHQDFEAYYYSQHTTNYLNMYLVVEKPEPLEAGLTVAPFDLIRARSPELYDVLVDNAATSWTPMADGMLVRNHKTYDKFYWQPFPWSDLECTPRLVPGDLLILRGDTPHRTQYPIRSYRTTISLRLSLSNFSVASMLEAGMVKHSRMHHGRPTFEGLALASWFGSVEATEALTEIQEGKTFNSWRNFKIYLAYNYLNVRIEIGYYGMMALSFVRILSGKLLGEQWMPMIYY